MNIKKKLKVVCAEGQNVLEYSKCCVFFFQLPCFSLRAKGQQMENLE